MSLLDRYPDLKQSLQGIHDEPGADQAPRIEDDY
jgi:hypothetical protein